MFYNSKQTYYNTLSWISITKLKSERAQDRCQFLKFPINFTSQYCHRVCQNHQKQTHGKNSHSKTTFLVLVLILPISYLANAGISAQCSLLPVPASHSLFWHDMLNMSMPSCKFETFFALWMFPKAWICVPKDLLVFHSSSPLLITTQVFLYGRLKRLCYVVSSSVGRHFWPVYLADGGCGAGPPPPFYTCSAVSPPMTSHSPQPAE